ncbi:pollen receptor-like kinase 4 [Oryza brachyantha]|uniref:pollen receptor-like kinase 4 n=1 Tax=Oryza brachyantha TaxID=4533 RepID=UPI001AD9D1ED|nr:pollen receptor-like kinase 4 [Oryza brachyantha]
MAGALCLLVRVLAVSFCLCLALATADAARFLAAAAAADGEADALLKLKAGIEDGGGALRSWSPGTSPCDGDASNWAGVMCSGGSVLGLQLEKMGLSGTLDLRPLSSLTSLRTLSFMDNKFAGPMPDVRELGGLRAIFLSGNKFSGEIPADAFAGMGWLKKVVLSRNSFSGAIPSSLTAVPRLLDLQLNDNKFQGKIPDFPQKDLKQFNVANNELEGEIPANLKSLGSEMFAGNDKLCGGPVEAKCEAASPPPVTSPAASDKIGASPSPPAATTTAAATTTTTTTGTAPTEDGTQQKPTEWSASFGVLAAFLGTVAIICFAVVALQRRREYNTENFGPTASTKPAMQSLPPSPAKTTHAAPRGSAAANDDRSSSAGGGSTVARGKAGEQGRLTFVRDDRGRFFELQDLLKATAEVLGSANLGVCYRATLTSGHSVVVKRFKEMNRVGKEDFEEHMRRLGRLSHPNLLPLIAYYYRKEEKLLIHDYAPNKSLAHLLHGEGKGIKKAVVHWAARVKLVKGVARALQYLYDELPMLTVPHGHLKASNILLDERFQPLLTDYALVPVMNQSHSAQLMVAFRSPERKQFGRSSKKSDVWCLGILILEILTGRPPSYEAAKPQQPPPPSDQPQPPPPENNLVGVVASTPEGEWLEAVVDADLRHEDDECKAEMVKLLKIGMACCETSVDSRWELKTAVDRIEELREGKEHANEDYSFYSSISDGAGRDNGDFANVAIN